MHTCMNSLIYTHMHTHTCTTSHMYTSKPHLPKKINRPRCYAKSPTAQDVFRPTPSLISYTGVIERWRLLSHAQNGVRWLALTKMHTHTYTHTHGQTDAHTCTHGKTDRLVALVQAIFSQFHNHILSCLQLSKLNMFDCLHR